MTEPTEKTPPPGEDEESSRLLIEQRLRHAQKAESLGRMAGAVAHHFNNLLGAMLGNLEQALDDLPRELAGPRANISEAMAASRQAAEISALMLAYLSQTAIKKEPRDLVKDCVETRPLLNATLPGKVRLKTAYPADGPVVLADAVQIKQILTNLVLNAVEAIGDSEGEIAVGVGAMPSEEIQAFRFYPRNWAPKEKSYAFISVTDTGIGIDPSVLQKLFDPLFSSRFVGRGLGLAVVMGLVRAHAGAVTVESQPGLGATFRVFLPMHGLERMPAKAEEGDKALEDVGGQGLVLLVEDDQRVRDMAQSMLKRLGYEPLAVGDGIEAVQTFRANRDRCVCVLLDLVMPRMDGWETLAALRAIRPGVPVIMCSGYNEAQVLEGKHSERPQCFLQKPYQKAEMRAALNKALGLQGPSAEPWAQPTP